MDWDMRVDLVNGISLGVELVPECEDHDRTLIIDLVLIRFVISWRSEE